MKIKINVSILTLAILLFSCDLFSSKEDEPKTELEKLPAMTTSGKNTFGFLLNGKAIIAPNSSQMTAIYQGGFIQFGGGINSKVMDINARMFVEDPIEIDKAYNLSNVPKYGAQYLDLNNADCYYELKDTFEGTVVFSKIDRINFIVSGTFKFSTALEGCDTIKITDGRFDMQYIP